MKCRYPKVTSERGIALVITLVMLAIVTMMAIVFLAVSRRERSSVKMAEDLATASSIAEAALERAKAEAIARMSMDGSKLAYDMFNSTNFVRPFFDSAQRFDAPAEPDNVSYVDQAGDPLSGGQYLRMLANLQYDARPPVFIETNQNPNAQPDFRFYLDFNRNRLYESNGWVRVVGTNGAVLTDANGDYITNNLVGDPEWIGVLERPDYPHSETNRFIGRMAYLVFPAGKQLDINAIHNQVFGDDRIDQAIPSQRNGFNRHQGVGPWEINLAAFLRELNTNSWLPQHYQFRSGGASGLSRGLAFDDARSILSFRYDGARRNLKSAGEIFSPTNLFNLANGQLFETDLVDNYTDDRPVLNGDPVFRPRGAGIFENDDTTKNWAGSFTTNGFTDIQQLFSLSNSVGLPARLTMRTQSTNDSTADRYTFYRLASQLGVDSKPALEGKLQLNYDNTIGQITNTIDRWTNAVRFFTNAADLMLRASIDRIVPRVENIPGVGRVTNVYYQIGDTLVRTNFSVHNLQIYNPNYQTDAFYRNGNEYTPTIHRILQVALNIYDSMTNRGTFPGGVARPSHPTVLRPVYEKTGTNMIIARFEEVTNQVNRTLTLSWRDPRDFYTNNFGIASNFNFFGQHYLIGAKKGFPNFNELALQSYVEVSRKLEVRKSGAGGPIVQTNQMFLVSLQNRWGMEAWNSYTSAYPRNVRIVGDVQSQVVIRDLGITNGASQVVYARNISAANGLTTNNWQPAAFEILLDRSFPLIADTAYSSLNGFRATNLVRFNPIEPAPRFQLVTTNDVRFWMIDLNTDRVIDFVSFNDLVTVMDISQMLYTQPTPQNQVAAGASKFNEGMFWDPALVAGSPSVTAGITNQLAVSVGDIDVDDTTWRAYRFNSPDKRGGIAAFRQFMGLGLRSTDPLNVNTATNVAMQTPFVPTRRIHQLITWQANDPLVHYMAQDLTRPPNSDKPQRLPISEPPPRWNIGRLNDVYHPWGGHPNVEPSKDPFAYNMALQDPGIRKSDDWQFPIDEVSTFTNVFIFPNIGALGRVHRGTPWQTLYLKSVYQFGLSNEVVEMAKPAVWQAWAGSRGTYPTVDWRLLDCFTTAVHENAARGLLSVNQTNRAAWSAILSGLTVPTNTIRDSALNGLAYNEGLEATNVYRALTIEPATPQIERIVYNINRARALQPEIIVNPNGANRQREPYILAPKTNALTMRPETVFGSVGDFLSAPALTVQSPFLNNSVKQVRHTYTDRAVEYIPQQILSLVRRDEPRFVVYAFGQSLKPAPRSLATDPDFYNLCTNYQIVGEVITKTTFRVEGELRDPANPLRTVVEDFEILPPPE